MVKGIVFYQMHRETYHISNAPSQGFLLNCSHIPNTIGNNLPLSSATCFVDLIPYTPIRAWWFIFLMTLKSQIFTVINLSKKPQVTQFR